MPDDNLKQSKVCPFCKKAIPSDAEYCPYCYHPLIEKFPNGVEIKKNNFETNIPNT